MAVFFGNIHIPTFCYSSKMFNEWLMAKSGLSTHMKKRKETGLIQGGHVGPETSYIFNKEREKYV